jgi:hypothetical protein
MQHLMENWRKYQNNPFQLLCEQHDKQLISEEQLFKIWEQNTLNEYTKLCEIDWEKEAELTADPDYKPPQDRPGMLQKGWEKINDWILEKSVQLVELARRSAGRALGSIAWLIKKVRDLCAGFKTLCKLIIMTLAVIAFYIAFHLIFESEAQAKLYRGRKPMTDTQVNAMKGELYDIIDLRQEKGQDHSQLVRLMAKIDDIHQAKGKHDILKAKDGTDRALNSLWNGVVEMWKGEGTSAAIPEEERTKTVIRWIDIGERVKAWYRESTKVWEPQNVTIGGQEFPVGGGSSKTADWGMSLAKKAGEAGEEVYDVYQKTRTQR